MATPKEKTNSEYTDSLEDELVLRSKTLTANQRRILETRRIIMREFKDFKMSVRRHEDPLELKSRVHLLTNGYMEIKKEEKEELTDIQS